jgi:AraC-like DNA-binding protein
MASELVDLALRYARRPGLSPTPVPGLQIIRADQRAARVHSMHRPSLCFIVQGAKEVAIGSVVMRYGSEHFIFSTIELPVTGEVLEATARRPYLCLVLDIEPSVVFELVSAAEAPRSSAGPKRAIFVGSDAAMTDAFLRLLRCSRSPIDVRVLAPSIIREITYWLLRGPYGDVVRQVGIADSQTQRIARAVERLKRDFAQPLRTAELARVAGMSVSSLHQHFRRVTTMSPLRYQKQLRLHEARRLLLGEATSAADAGFRVGYQSPSQFSREYARYFGLPPISETRQARERT